MYEEIKDPMKTENPLIKRVLYRIQKDFEGKEEVGISGYDMGSHVYCKMA